MGFIFNASSVAAQESFRLRPVFFGGLEGWQTDTQGEALIAFKQSCDILLKRPANRAFGGHPALDVTTGDWHRACAAAMQMHSYTDADARDFFEKWMQPYVVYSQTGREGKLTGYYEASITASRTQGGEFQHPIYAKPADLIRRNGANGQEWGRLVNGSLKPYYTRAEIMDGALKGKADVLLWANCPIDVFFLHVQGSGMATLPDGTQVHIGYAEKSGHEYRSIGTEIIARGALEPRNTTMQTIRAWMRDNPKEADSVMRINPSYIFFRELPDGGPIGGMGIPLIQQRSMAVDTAFIPYGTPVWIDMTANYRVTHNIHRLMVAHDTGSAIKGAVRGDYFWGAGEHAEEMAGKMNNPVAFTILLPRRHYTKNTSSVSSVAKTN